MKVWPRKAGEQGGTSVLRWMVAGSAVLLVAVVGGFVLAGRLRMKNYLKGLPARLGVDIEQETNNFTYSQSKGHRKMFTVHAAKEIQHKGGTITLHGVEIVLYGPTDEATDRISGTDFEYSPKAQTLKATGDVYVDLIPPPNKQVDVGLAKQADVASREIHVKTVGLLFNKSEQTATTDGAVEFRSGGYKGDAVGASYDAEHGVIVLQSAVRMSGMRAGKVVTLTAVRAEMDRVAGDGHLDSIDLKQPRYVATGVTGTQSFAADYAMVRTTADGTPREVNAEGEVTLVRGSASGSREKPASLRSNRLEVEFSAEGQTKAAHLYGAVRYEGEDAAGRREHGTADDARLGFDAAGRAEHAVFAGQEAGIQFVEEGVGVRRTLEAARLEVGLGGRGKEPLVVRTAEASGGGRGARLLLSDADRSAGAPTGRSETEVRADRLVGAFRAGGKRAELTALDGTGHAAVQRISYGANGVETAKDTSAGDTLRLDFGADETGVSELRRGELRSGVTTVYEAWQKTGANAGRMSTAHARADDAFFEGDQNVVHLVGSAEVQDEASAVFADRVDVNRRTGDATATGSVKVSYVGDGAAKAGTEPVHVLAARCIAHKSTGLTEFFSDAKADGNAPVRLWQGTSQVEASEVDLDQREKRVIAKGNDAIPVRTVLRGGKDSKSGAAWVRIFSREMMYTDAEGTVEFTGGVRVLDLDGTLLAKRASVWLAKAPTGAKIDDAGLMAGKVDHMIASGGVVLTQPGRKGTGEKLVYTAADGLFVLTGSATAPPKVVDAAQGTTTGAALRFHSADDSVEVLGSDGSIAGRVRSETRMRQ